MKTSHSRHIGEMPSRTCSSKNIGVKDALERTKSYVNRAEVITEKLKLSRKNWLTQCAEVETEIEEFVEEYKRQIDEHKENLLKQVKCLVHFYRPLQM